MIVLQRVAEAVLERAPAGQILRHLRIEEAPGAPPLALGAVEREIGVAHQRADVARRCRARPPARSSSRSGSRGRRRGTGSETSCSTRSASGASIAGSVTFGTTMANSSPESRASRSPPRSDAFRRLAAALQQAVADRMAERVVDRLEAVEVEHEERRLVAARARRSASVSAMNSSNCLRFGRPVSSSCKARKRMAAFSAASWRWR